MREYRLTKRLKEYDSQLFAKKAEDGVIHILRRTVVWDSFQFNGDTYRYSRYEPHFVFALTDNWKPSGKPVDCSSDVVLNRIKAMDLWRDDQFVERLLAGYEKDKETKERHMRNDIESFLYEFRPQFAKTFNDVNTSTMEKTDARRLKGI